MTELEDIIRAVAGCEPLAQSADDIYGIWFTCGFCDAYIWGQRIEPGVYEPGVPVEHTPECLWRRAREWVEVNPVRDEAPGT